MRAKNPRNRGPHKSLGLFDRPTLTTSFVAIYVSPSIRFMTYHLSWADRADMQGRHPSTPITTSEAETNEVDVN